MELESDRLRAEGRAEGETNGEERVSILINRLILDKRSDEILRATTDKEFRKKLYSEYGL